MLGNCWYFKGSTTDSRQVLIISGLLPAFANRVFEQVLTGFVSSISERRHETSM